MIDCFYGCQDELFELPKSLVSVNNKVILLKEFKYLLIFNNFGILSQVLLHFSSLLDGFIDISIDEVIQFILNLLEQLLKFEVHFVA